jgi:predicted GNAT family acetyltransferase
MKINKSGNMFYVGDTVENRLAEITYRQKGNTLIIDHTLVKDELRGQGVAKKLVDEVVSYARSENLKIYPVCSYAVKILAGKEEYADVVVDEVK